MSTNYKLYAKYYDLFYKNKDYKAETNYVHNIIQKNKPGSKTLLEFGSGTGKHGKFFVNLGYKVIGVERSSEMVDIANSHNNNNNFNSIVGNISDIKLNQNFDAVVSLFHVIGYQTKNSQLLKVFNNAFQHLKDEGLFIFDVWFSPAVFSQKLDVRIKRVKSKDLKIVRIAEPIVDYEKNEVDVHYQIFIANLSTGKVDEIKEVHPVRHFSIPEISILASNSGFELLRSEEFLTGNSPSDNTWGVCFVLKKVIV